MFLKRNEQTDEELMHAMAQGDTASFSLLYDRYADKMIRYFYRMLGQDQAKAEDFAQDIFTKLIEKPHLFDTSRKFSTWIYSVANNMCKNEYRKLSVRRNTINAEPDAEKTKDHYGEDVIATMDRKTFDKLLNIELGLLDEKHRSTFLLRYQEEMSIKEISEALDISEGTVKSRLFYTIRKLSDKLKVFDLN